MAKTLDHVNALFFVIQSFEDNLGTQGFSPFSVATIKKFVDAYKADPNPQDGNSTLVTPAFFASLVQVGDFVPNMTPINIVTPKEFNKHTVDLATAGKYEAKPFERDMTLTTRMGDISLAFFNATHAPTEDN